MGDKEQFDALAMGAAKNTLRATGYMTKRAAKGIWRFLLTNTPLKPVILLLIGLAVVIFLLIFMYQSKVDAVSDLFSGIGNKSSQEYLKGLSQDEIDRVKQDGIVDPDRMMKYMEIEEQSIEPNKTVKAKVVTKTIVEAGGKTSVEEKTEYTDYEINLSDVMHPYRLWYQMPASIDIYLDMKDYEAEDLIKKVQSDLSPEFEWDFSTYTRDATEATETVIESYDNGKKMGETKTTVERTTYYPLPCLKKVRTAFKQYTFNYTQNVVEKDEWTSASTSTDQTSQTTTRTRTHTKIVTDKMTGIDEQPEYRFQKFMDDYGIPADDLFVLNDIAEGMPESDDFIYNLDTYIEDNVAGYRFATSDTSDSKQEYKPTESMAGINLDTSYPSAEISKWLNGDVDVNTIFASRLAALAQSYGKTITITSGYRSYAEQKAIWDSTPVERRGIYVAAPGKSRHQYGLAADVAGWAKNLTNNELLPFGLYKPMSYENWHIEPVETKTGR